MNQLASWLRIRQPSPSLKTRFYIRLDGSHGFEVAYRQMKEFVASGRSSVYKTRPASHAHAKTERAVETRNACKDAVMATTWRHIFQG
ncbi:uncharacterized protein N7484_007762 [Penicillium longicatenatum]|uniref:uncharacterized protein n=1 Tax=Penicillium longicatenatum TaxID=1561947 RepID=UPI002548F0A6|nr:uncharacterized protein N7484_007762 [Penicillium longicatenatum]KAJ5639900.1 hypothetical protein N7484_007762 [Penicillium longicatenatum]